MATARRRGPTPLQLARLLRGAAADKKAWDCVVLDVRDKTSLADYFVICEGETDRQVRAIADGMVQAAKEKKLRPLGVDGYEDATWILLDFDSVLAHVFLPGERSYYDLESLWAPVHPAKSRDFARTPEHPAKSRDFARTPEHPAKSRDFAGTPDATKRRNKAS